MGENRYQVPWLVVGLYCLPIIAVFGALAIGIWLL